MKRAIVILGFGLVAACGAGSDSKGPPQVPTSVFPDAEIPSRFNRAYGMTESMDGKIRVFVRENRDVARLYAVRRQNDGLWSAPEELDLPGYNTLTDPSFSFADGMLYYASDATVFGRGQNDANIWRVAATDDGWSEPEPLPESINTFADNLSPAMDRKGRLYFTSNGRGGAGGHDIYEAEFDPETETWTTRPMPEGFNHFRADAHIAVTPDGNRIFFYSHRTPKLGVVDIWTAARSGDGTWGLPVNLGEPVNTSGIDYGPGLSADGLTLFFSRDGVLMEISLQSALAGLGTLNADS